MLQARLATTPELSAAVGLKRVVTLSRPEQLADPIAKTAVPRFRLCLKTSVALSGTPSSEGYRPSSMRPIPVRRSSLSS